MVNQNPRKKKLITVIMVLGIIAVAVVSAVIYYGTKEKKTPLEEQMQEKAELFEEITNMSGKEAENKEEMIAKIKLIVSGVMSGNNISGSPYLKDNFVDRRITEREEYFANVEFYADEHKITTDYKAKLLEDYEAIKLKCAEFFKAIYKDVNKVYYASCKSFNADDELRPTFSALVEKEDAEKVDWKKDTATLATDVLPNVWKVSSNEYWLVE